MKGYRFYLEFPTETAKRKATRKNPSGHSGTVFAQDTDTDVYLSSCGATVEGFAPVVARPNTSQIIYGQSTIEYLRKNCLRISEAQAREIHPALFSYIEAAEAFANRISENEK